MRKVLGSEDCLVSVREGRLVDSCLPKICKIECDGKTLAQSWGQCCFLPACLLRFGFLRLALNYQLSCLCLGVMGIYHIACIIYLAFVPLQCDFRWVTQLTLISLLVNEDAVLLRWGGVGGSAQATVHTWRTEGSLQKSILSLPCEPQGSIPGCQSDLVTGAFTSQAISPTLDVGTNLVSRSYARWSITDASL